MNWDELPVQLWPAEHSSHVTCGSAHPLLGRAPPTGGSNFGDIQGSLKSELIGQVLRFCLVCLLFSPQCLALVACLHLLFFRPASLFTKLRAQSCGGCPRTGHRHCPRWQKRVHARRARVKGSVEMQTGTSGASPAPKSLRGQRWEVSLGPRLDRGKNF